MTKSSSFKTWLTFAHKNLVTCCFTYEVWGVRLVSPDLLLVYYVDCWGDADVFMCWSTRDIAYCQLPAVWGFPVDFKMDVCCFRFSRRFLYNTIITLFLSSYPRGQCFRGVLPLLSQGWMLQGGSSSLILGVNATGVLLLSLEII